MAIAFVQKTARFTASAASSVTSGTLTTTAGNTGALSLSTWLSPDTGAPTWTDSKSNTTAVDKTYVETALGRSRATIGSCRLASAGSSHSWTVNFPAGTYCEGNVSEYSGVATSPLDQTASTEWGSGGSSANTSATPTTGATAQADEVVIAVVVVNNNIANAGISDPPSTGYTSLGVNQASSSTIGYEGAYKIVSSTGAQSATWNFTAPGSGAAVVATYKATTAGASGSGSPSNANDASAASGTTTVKGTLARTNANDTSAASGTTKIVGTLAKTNANDTSSASGSTTVKGSVARTNANDTASASGSPIVSGALARTNANDTANASGSTGAVSGSAAYTNANDQASASGTTKVVGALAASNADDGATASGTTAIVGLLAASNADDTAEASGAAGAVSGTVDYTNRDDLADASGSAGESVAAADDYKVRKKYVVRVGNRLLAFTDPAQALQLVEKPAPKLVKQLEKKAEKVVPLAKVKPYVSQYQELLKHQEYEEMLARYEDEQDVEMLLLAL